MSLERNRRTAAPNPGPFILLPTLNGVQDVIEGLKSMLRSFLKDITIQRAYSITITN